MSGLSGVSLGQFIPGDSFIHRLDPRNKIVSTVVLLTGLFMTHSPLDFALWALLLGVLSRYSGVPVRTILRSAKPIWFLVLITLLLNLLWTPGVEIFRLSFLSVTYEGVLLGVSMGLRLFFLVVFAAFLMMTTSPMSFSDGLERLLSPLAKIRFPASEMAMMMTIALRFIPTLFEEADRILKAQLSRGADFESGGLLRRAKSYIPVLVPLFVLVFQRAENLAVAMESRCYLPGAPRTRLNPLVWRGCDTVALCFLTIFTALVLFIDRKYLVGVLSWGAMQ